MSIALVDNDLKVIICAVRFLTRLDKSYLKNCTTGQISCLVLGQSKNGTEPEMKPTIGCIFV
uniref:Uncharacterized protein n=1 Tax=Anguilla anguilla TaxID=7936 RepID=A0A0E9XI63_ANGAN